MPPASSIVTPGITKLFDQILAANGSFDTGATIPQGFSALFLVASLRSNQAGVDGCGLRFNNDSGANYDRAYVRNDGNASQTGRTSIDSLVSVGTSADANTYAQNEFWIPNYADTTTRKICVGTVWAYQAAGTGNMFIGTAGGRWSSTNAITQIQLISTGSSVLAGSRLIVYGLV